MGDIHRRRRALHALQQLLLLLHTRCRRSTVRAHARARGRGSENLKKKKNTQTDG